MKIGQSPSNLGEEAAWRDHGHIVPTNRRNFQARRWKSHQPFHQLSAG